VKFSVEENNIANCFYRALLDHKVHGRAEQIRGTTRYEILDYTICLTDPAQNILFVPFRESNFPAIIAETLWVLAGRIDMYFLRYYLKNAMKYSDDGQVWRGGYGKRLINYNTMDDDGHRVAINQIDRLINYLKKDRTTSRAVLVIPDGSDYHMNDEDEQRKDEPCTMFVQYAQRGAELHCFVRMRSNDVMLGCFNVNLMEWTFLHQMIANEINSQVGTYNVNAVSMHIYDNWMKKLPLLLYAQPKKDVYSLIPEYKIQLTWAEFKKDINIFLAIEQDMRSHKNIKRAIDILFDKRIHQDLIDCFCVMSITMLLKHKLYGDLSFPLRLIDAPAWRVAALEYVARKLGPHYRGVIENLSEAILEGLDRENIMPYIEHSWHKQEILDEMEGVRR